MRRHVSGVSFAETVGTAGEERGNGVAGFFHHSLCESVAITIRGVCDGVL